MGYITNICEDNYKNDICAAIPDKKIERDQIDSGYIYSNFDNRWKNPTLQLLSAIDNIKTTDLSSDSISPLIISHCSRGRLVLLNHWEDPPYFSLSFLHLFPNGTEADLEKRKQLILVEV